MKILQITLVFVALVGLNFGAVVVRLDDNRLHTYLASSDRLLAQNIDKSQSTDESESTSEVFVNRASLEDNSGEQSDVISEESVEEPSAPSSEEKDIQTNRRNVKRDIPDVEGCGCNKNPHEDSHNHDLYMEYKSKKPRHKRASPTTFQEDESVKESKSCGCASKNAIVRHPRSIDDSPDKQKPSCGCQAKVVMPESVYKSDETINLEKVTAKRRRSINNSPDENSSKETEVIARVDDQPHVVKLEPKVILRKRRSSDKSSEEDSSEETKTIARVDDQPHVVKLEPKVILRKRRSSDKSSEEDSSEETKVIARVDDQPDVFKLEPKENSRKRRTSDKSSEENSSEKTKIDDKPHEYELEPRKRSIDKAFEENSSEEAKVDLSKTADIALIESLPKRFSLNDVLFIETLSKEQMRNLHELFVTDFHSYRLKDSQSKINADENLSNETKSDDALNSYIGGNSATPDNFADDYVQGCEGFEQNSNEANETTYNDDNENKAGEK